MNYVLTSWLFITLSQLPQQFNTSLSQRWTVQFLGCSVYGMEEPNFISLCTELPQPTPSDLSLSPKVLKGPSSSCSAFTAGVSMSWARGTAGRPLSCHRAELASRPCCDSGWVTHTVDKWMCYRGLFGLMRYTFTNFYSQLLSLQNSKTKPWKHLAVWLTEGKETWFENPMGIICELFL